MKKVLMLMCSVILALSSTPAQSPQSFSYQSIVRDGNGNIVANQQVSFRMSIYSGSATGTLEYSETHSVTTNEFGLAVFAVGAGTVVSGNFAAINWGAASHFLKVEADITGGANYVDMGTTQLLSVPYALHSKTSEDAFSGNYSDLTGVPTNVSNFNNDAGYLTSFTEVDGDVTNELQVLSVSNDTLYLSNGGFVSLAGYSDTLWRQSGNNIYNTNPGKVGVGTNAPPAKLVVQGDASMADTVPLFEVKDRDGHTVFIIYPDSARLYVGDDGSKTNKGAFAVSGRNTAKQPTHDFLWVTPDSTRIFTGDNEAGFGVENIETGGTQRYMKLNPDNYFIGHNSGISNTTGAFNNYLGYETGFANTVGNYNVFLGYNAGRNNNIGSSNTFLGFSAGWNSNGQSNIAIGNNSLGNSNTGQSNVAVGNQALAYNTTGEYNVAIGNNSLFYNADGNFNVAVGAEAGRSNNSGSRNISMGYQSLFSNTSGNENVTLGYRSGYTNTTGSNNVFLGYYAGYTSNANYNVFLGYESGRNNTSGTNNTFIGYLSGRSNTIGSSNVFIGDNAGYSNNQANCNLAIGQYALYNNANFGNNIAIGYQVLYSNTGGWSNVAIGNTAMYYNTSGPSNVAIGEQALYRNTTGGANVAVGKYTLYYNTGNDNTAVGNGAYFGFSATSYNNSTALGYGSVISASNQVRVGNTSVTSIGGQVGWTTLSDGRFKTNVQADIPGLEFIRQLEPVSYNLDINAINQFYQLPDSLRQFDAERERSKVRYTGFIAQDVEKVASDLGFEFSGIDKPKNDKDHYGLRYAEFTVPLVRAVQELDEANKQLIEENKQLRIVVEQLNKRIEKLENK